MGPRTNQQTMHKEETIKMIPELRFPEFVNKGGWVLLNGNILFEPVSNKDHHSDLPILAITQEYGAIPRDKIDYKVFVSEESVESYKVVEVGDFIISLRSFQGGIEYSVFKGICSPAYIILRKRNPEDIDGFYKQYFKTDHYIVELNRNIEGIRDGKMVSYKQFSDILLPNPSPEEQQRIADFLSSTDEVIAVQNEKLAALENQKKGLMQDLFPQEGKKVPKVRFPGFEKDRAWKEVRLEELAERIVQRNTHTRIDKVLTNSANDGIVDQRDYFDKDIANKSNLENYYIVEPGDFVYNPRVSTVAPVGPISKNRMSATGVMSPLYTIFRFNHERNDFYEYYFKSAHWHESIRKIANTGARFDRMSITSSDLMATSVLHPPLEEQQKIAQCLSSLDEVLAAQIEKMEQLKLHKKGLMQRLFLAANA